MMAMSRHRIEQRRQYDKEAREALALNHPWAKRYLSDPNRVLEEWDAQQASSLLRGLNLNRYSQETRSLIRAARVAAAEASRAIFNENWGR